MLTMTALEDNDGLWRGIVEFFETEVGKASHGVLERPDGEGRRAKIDQVALPHTHMTRLLSWHVCKTYGCYKPAFSCWTLSLLHFQGGFRKTTVEAYGRSPRHPQWHGRSDQVVCRATTCDPVARLLPDLYTIDSPAVDPLHQEPGHSNMTS